MFACALWWSEAYRVVPDNKVHGANMGPTWGREDPGGSHAGPMNFAIWVALVRDPARAVDNHS